MAKRQVGKYYSRFYMGRSGDPTSVDFQEETKLLLPEMLCGLGRHIPTRFDFKDYPNVIEIKLETQMWDARLVAYLYVEEISTDDRPVDTPAELDTGGG